MPGSVGQIEAGNISAVMKLTKNGGVVVGKRGVPGSNVPLVTIVADLMADGASHTRKLIPS
jgi:hypothetical protein